MAAYIVANSGTITLVIGGKRFQVPTEHPNYDAIKKNLNSKDAVLLPLVDVAKTVQAKFDSSSLSGKVEVKYGEVYFNNEPLRNSLSQRILDMMNKGYGVEPFVKFLENLMSNPSARAISELYDFLEHRALPITEDGCFLAYKSVRSDFKDKYSGTIDNSIGKVVEFPRNKVDDDRAHECSYGLHVGALAYSGPGGWYNSANDKVVIVKVNPADAVSVPQDHNAQKLRVCKYEVVSLYDGSMEDSPVYNSVGKPSDKNNDFDVDVDVDYVSSDDAFTEGYDDGNFGLSKANPYCQDKQANAYYSYNEGYDEGYYDYQVELELDEDDEYEDEDDDCCDCGNNSCLGKRPDGTNYYNGRGPDGKFTKKN
jgi:hypothetical protein